MLAGGYRWCLSCLLLCDKTPQCHGLETAHIQVTTFCMSQESRHRLTASPAWGSHKAESRYGRGRHSHLRFRRWLGSEFSPLHLGTDVPTFFMSALGSLLCGSVPCTLHPCAAVCFLLAIRGLSAATSCLCGLI